mgnify:CR=1 FL=1
MEEHLDRDMQEYHWWVVHGQPVFVCARCDVPGEKRGSYYTADFRELAIKSVLGPCTNVTKPPTWNRMVKIVKQVGAHIPGVVSIDVFANETDVFFSELTFSRNGCSGPSPARKCEPP